MTTTDYDDDLSEEEADDLLAFYVTVIRADDATTEELAFEQRNQSGTLSHIGYYAHRSHLIAVRSANGQIAGLARIIAPLVEGACVNRFDSEIEDWTANAAVPDTAWELASYAVGARFKAPSSIVNAALWQAVIQLVKANEATDLVALLDVGQLNALQLVGLSPWLTIFGADPQPWGLSMAVIPAVCPLDNYEAKLSTCHPATWELLFLGAGLEETVARPAGWKVGR